MDRCVHKITGITVTEKQSVCEQRSGSMKLRYAARRGGWASQGRERQPSVAARSIWMTLYYIFQTLKNREHAKFKFSLSTSFRDINFLVNITNKESAW